MTENQMKITFGKNFRMLLDDRRRENPKDWTYRMLEEHLHVTTRAMQKWEKGESFPTVYKLALIADLFQVSTDSLLGRRRFRIYEDEDVSDNLLRG